MAVKVKLTCPNCRVDLSRSIHQILECRRKEECKQYWNMPDSELSAKELRLKYMYENESVVQNAATGEVSLTRNFTEDEDDPKGKHNNNEEGHNKDDDEEIVVDKTLFTGLEYAMTDDEQSYLYGLMTGGNPEKLHQAAQLLANIAEMALKGITPSKRTSNPPTTTTISQQRKPTSLRTGRSGTAGAGRAFQNMNNHEREKERFKQQKIEALKKEHPLPVRMPKFIQLAINTFPDPYNVKRASLMFVDDVPWNGLDVVDAYSRVVIRKKDGAVLRNLPFMSDKISIVPAFMTESLAGSEEAHESGGRTRRVVISNIRGVAGRYGCQIGDVVTHINGEFFDGDAENLRMLLHSLWEEGCSTGTPFFTLTVNADDCTAQAIRLRAKRMRAAIK
uniref:PDZ domain-containing protein n=1 Tax=Ditylum brightwellii TaxID=49249 RepID=A0A7S4T5X1_9STRA